VRGDEVQEDSELSAAA